MPDLQVLFELEPQKRNAAALGLLDLQGRVDPLEAVDRRVVGRHWFVLSGVRRMLLKDVVYAMMDHMLKLVFLAYHRVLIVVRLDLELRVHHGRHHVDPLDLVLQPSRVVSFASRNEGSKGRVHDIVFVEELVLLALVGPAHLIELPDVLVPHFLNQGKVCALAGLIFEVDVAEVAEVDVHFADRSK